MLIIEFKNNFKYILSLLTFYEIFSYTAILTHCALSHVPHTVYSSGQHNTSFMVNCAC